jgi:hypothetical protein
LHVVSRGKLRSDDLLVLAGQDIRALPLHKRKAQLKRLLCEQMPSVLLVSGFYRTSRLSPSRQAGIFDSVLDDEGPKVPGRSQKVASTALSR